MADEPSDGLPVAALRESISDGRSGTLRLEAGWLLTIVGNGDCMVDGLSRTLRLEAD